MASRASKLADLASTDSYAFSSVTTDTLSSSGAKSAFISGNFTITNTESKAGFATYLYTGNNTYPRSFTDVGVDLDTQWGDNPSERYGGLVWIKTRTVVSAGNHILCDTIRGTNNTLFTNQTLQAYTDRGVSSFNDDGFSVSLTNNDYNGSTATYAAWIFQTTHRVSGTTNHGKAYTSHYNPYTGFTIVRYEGSGVAGHEIPHHLGRELGMWVHKNLDSTSTGRVHWLNGSSRLELFSTTGTAIGVTDAYYCDNNSNSIIIQGSAGSHIDWNVGTDTYIMYGWANSYYDDAGELNGNYEIGVYQGTGAAGNKITTRGKPAWVMIKSLTGTLGWYMSDNQRGSLQYLQANASNAEGTTTEPTYQEDGFTVSSTSSAFNALGDQYLYMVIYDNDSASGKSNYTKSLEASTLQVTNGVVSYSHGVDSTGAVNSIENLGTTTLPNISWDI